MAGLRWQQNTPPQSPDEPYRPNRTNVPAQTQTAQSPTGLALEPLNIVILGASYAGLAVAHHFLDHVINKLRTVPSIPGYRLIIVSPSTHLYWNIAAPRALVSSDLLSYDDIFISIEQGFHRHRGHNFTIVQGEAVKIDFSARTVAVELIGSTAQKRASQINKRRSQAVSLQGLSGNGNGKIETISYHSLIIATGTRAKSDLLSLHGPHLNTLGALTAFHARVVAAESIVIGGGGCSGVETAGQLAAFLNYRSHVPCFKRRIEKPKRITLISGHDRLLPMQRPSMGTKAEKQLRKLGVEVLHNVRIIAARESSTPDPESGQSKRSISLNNESAPLTADLYIPCTGVEPNTSFMPPELLDEKGYVCIRNTPSQQHLENIGVGSGDHAYPDRFTFHVQQPRGGSDGQLHHIDVGDRVYAFGDCAAYSEHDLASIYDALPILMHNILHDLWAHEEKLSWYGGHGGGGPGAEKEVLREKHFALKKGGVKDVAVPIGRFGGVGAIRGVVIEGPVVWALKGKDWLVGRSRRMVEGTGRAS